MKKQKLMNDLMQGLLMAAVVATAVPMVHSVVAADLKDAVTNSGTQVFANVMQLVSYGAYAVGAVLGISGIMGFKKHTDNPSSNPLGPALGKLGAGAVLLASPGLIAIMQGTGSDVVNGSTGAATFTGGF